MTRPQLEAVWRRVTNAVVPTAPWWFRYAAPAVIALTLVCAGCGGAASHHPKVSTGASAASGVAMIVQFSKCMRSHGVTNFPDPSGTGDLNQTGINTNAPAYRTAESYCSKHYLHGALIPPGSDTHPSSLTMVQMLAVARCMRRHGIEWFPDPSTYIPSSLPQGSEATNYNGAIMVFLPQQMAQAKTPSYQRKAKLCGAMQLTNH